jgi:hypothetical protein
VWVSYDLCHPWQISCSWIRNGEDVSSRPSPPPAAAPPIRCISECIRLFLHVLTVAGLPTNHIKSAFSKPKSCPKEKKKTSLELKGVARFLFTTCQGATSRMTIIHIRWTLELRPAWHTNNFSYDQNFSFDLRPHSWVTTRMPLKAKTCIRFCGCKQRPEMRS